MFNNSLNIPYQQNFLQQPHFLMIFFYLTNSKRDDLELIIAFLQKYNIQFIKLENKKESQIIRFLGTNVNYVAYCLESISPVQFKDIAQYLSSKVLVVAFFHTNSICQLSRINASFSSNRYPFFFKHLTEVIV